MGHVLFLADTQPGQSLEAVAATSLRMLACGIVYTKASIFCVWFRRTHKPDHGVSIQDQAL